MSVTISDDLQIFCICARH